MRVLNRTYHFLHTLAFFLLTYSHVAQAQSNNMTVTLGNDTTITCNDGSFAKNLDFVLKAQVTNAPPDVNINWSFKEGPEQPLSNGSNDGDKSKLLITFLKVGVYTYTVNAVSASTGAKASDEITIEVTCGGTNPPVDPDPPTPPTNPNTLSPKKMFSPNNDGINDKWIIEGITTYPNISIHILNGYGKIIHRIDNPSQNELWDGRVNDKLLPVDTYYYVVYQQKKKLLSGSVTLIR
jgi:gliding motility-associated-like protein